MKLYPPLFLFCLFSCLFFQLSSAQYVWRHKACLPGPARLGLFFSIGNEAYYLGGPSTIPELWQYDVTSNVWTQKNNFPGAAYVGLVFVINDTAYAGCGLDTLGNYHTDFWKYNATMDSWTPVAPFIGPARYSAMGFTLNNMGYLGCGKAVGEYNDFYQYNPANNTWTQKASFPGSTRQFGLGLAAGGLGYMGFGYDGNNCLNDCYQYNPALDSWSQISNLPAVGRDGPGCFVINDTIYVLMGGDLPAPNGLCTLFPMDCWRYDVTGNTWIAEPTPACIAAPRSPGGGVTLNGHGYIACGRDTIEHCFNDLLEFGLPDTEFVNRVHVLGNDTNYCSGFARQLSVDDSCAAWSTGYIGSQITIDTAGAYWVTFNDSCGVSTDTIKIGQGGGSVSINSNKTKVCPGDSVQICAPSGFTNYNWNTGETTGCISTANAGNYYVTVSENGNCSAISNTINIGVYQPAPVTISVSGDTLSAYSANSYQWLLNGSPINSATSSIYIANASGTYTLQITDSNGCTATSSPIVISGIANQLPESAITLFPNPTSTSWQLTVSDELLGSIAQVFDATGRLVFQSEIRSAQSTINLPNAASGVYELRITSNEFEVVRKLVKCP